MNGLALYSGIAGIELGLKIAVPGYRTVCYVEREAYPASITVSRMGEKVLDEAVVWDDAETFDGTTWRGKVDIISAGFPCQPFSVAGKRKGERDERNMWPATNRILCEIRPSFCFLENVPALTTADKLILYGTVEEGRAYTLEEWEDFCQVHAVRFKLPSYFGRILGDLAEAGYDAEWCVLGADDVGAPHRRKRIWILAYTEGKRTESIQFTGQRHSPQSSGETLANADGNEPAQPERSKPDIGGRLGDESQKVPDAADNGRSRSRLARTRRNGFEDCGKIQITIRSGLEGAECEVLAKQASGGYNPDFTGSDWWSVEPDVGRVAHGISFRMDRLRALGNAVVPVVAATAWRILLARLFEAGMIDV